MRGRLIRIFLYAACLGAVIYTPAAHTLKSFIGGTPRYNGIEVTEAIRHKISGVDLLLFGDDRFIPPFLAAMAEKYGGSGKRRLHWIFPTLMGSRALEEAMVLDFLCLVTDNGNGPVTWLLNRDRIQKGAAVVGQQVGVVVQTFRRRIWVDFRIDGVHYDVHDGIFLRGGILRVVAEDENASNLVLFPDLGLPSQCARIMKSRDTVSMGKIN